MRRWTLVCDRCEREVSGEEFIPTDKWKKLTLLEGSTVLGEFCPDCLGELRRWLKKNRSEP